MFGLFSNNKRIERVAENASILLGSQIRAQLGLNLSEQIFFERARVDPYLIGYIVGTTKVYSDIAGLNAQQMGEATLLAGRNILATSDNLFAKLYLTCVRGKDQETLAGLEDGTTDTRELLAAHISGKPSDVVTHLQRHLMEVYASSAERKSQSSISAKDRRDIRASSLGSDEWEDDIPG